MLSKAMVGQLAKLQMRLVSTAEELIIPKNSLNNTQQAGYRDCFVPRL
jgi:hypothetical protein